MADSSVNDKRFRLVLDFASVLHLRYSEKMGDSPSATDYEMRVALTLKKLASYVAHCLLKASS